MNTLDTNTIIRFFNGECSENERLQVMEWVNASEQNAAQFFRWEEFYHLGKSRAMDDIALRKAERKLFDKIDAEREHLHHIRKINQWVRYAAVITVLLAVSGLAAWHFAATSRASWVTIRTHAGETKEILLSDNSKVWLNENSELSYPRAFKGNKRSLELNGEAYFEVTKNKHQPFTVQGQSMSVEVLGTKFNFKSCSECLIAEASLIEGEVKVRGNHHEGSIVLSPGQKVELNLSTKQMKVFSTYAAIDAIWHDNLIPFKNANLFNIADVLEKVYGVNIVLSPETDRTTTYSGVLKRKSSIEDVLKLLQSTIHLQYRMEKDSIYLSLYKNK